MYVTMAEIAKRAMEGGYGVTAPNVYDEFSVTAAISAAEELNAPVILDVTPGMAPNGFHHFMKMTIEKARDAKVPVCTNLDHGGTFEVCIQALREGCSSIMADRSVLPLEENIAQVAELANIAHICGASIEAELGHVGQGMTYAADRDAGMTNPAEAKEFVEKTKVDLLAIAMGTAHGVYKGTPHLDFDVLAAVRKAIPNTPLVLHGGSGTGDENLARATREGIAKVNIFTDLSLAAVAAIRENGFSENMGVLPVMNIMMKGYKDKLVHYMKLFNMENKAW
ncbi:class II fructose-bisphosphate aldolase [Christensenella sp. MSJ-20]|uniref:class II fructose-bisphosphate aldolase n=1 Tax=Christensenella sp. MSJ-20 TaxID=2841518 RepID=UPI000D791501|nr:MAG: fructose-bisphosphate aldolase [Bacillota bacterium]QWT54713.1 class II fructose-bisphosphate aldolase [Christensenella sp. MSJ-20]